VKRRSTHDDRARERILDWIARSGLTQHEIARAIGRTQPWLSRYLKGALNADFETLAKLASVFGHSLGSLIDPPEEERVTVERLRLLRDEDREAVEKLITHFLLAGAARARARK